jgi:hypothetical protein
MCEAIGSMGFTMGMIVARPLFLMFLFVRASAQSSLLIHAITVCRSVGALMRISPLFRRSLGGFRMGGAPSPCACVDFCSIRHGVQVAFCSPLFVVHGFVGTLATKALLMMINSVRVMFRKDLDSMGDIVVVMTY